MKQGKTREMLLSQLQKAIYLLDNNVIQEKIIKSMMRKGYSRGFISDILEGNALLEPLSLLDLGVVAKKVYEIGGITTINPKIFFEEIEIEEINNHKVEQLEKDNKNLLVFENVTQISNDMWTMVVPCQRIAELYRANAVKYDFKTQREARNIKSKDTIIQVANVNWVSVEEIKDQLVRGLFIPNTITFNVPIEKADEIKYDKNKKRLIILEKSLKILDGFHRSLGIIAALRESDLNYNFEVRITNFSIDKARRFIVQEDKRNPINKEYIKSIDTTDRITVVVNNLNQNNNSELNGMITSDSTLITSGNALVDFNTMYITIKSFWKPLTLVETNDITEYLTNFFNELVSLYLEEFKLHIKESRRLNNINRSQMFVVYLTLAKVLENDVYWKEKLKLVTTSLESQSLNEIINTPLHQIRKEIDKYIEISKQIIEGVLINEG